MPNDWLRPTTVFPGGGTLYGLPSVTGGPFPDGVEAYCSSGYGPRTPIRLPDGTFTGYFHPGAYFWRPEWAALPCDLLSLSDGIVERAESGWPGEGNWIQVRTLDGAWAWSYFHMRDAPSLRVGDPVYAGQVVGVVGTTGWSTGVHVHVQVIDNTTPTDPIAVFEAALDVGETVPDPERMTPADLARVWEVVQRGQGTATARMWPVPATNPGWRAWTVEVQREGL